VSSTAVSKLGTEAEELDSAEQVCRPEDAAPNEIADSLHNPTDVYAYEFLGEIGTDAARNCPHLCSDVTLNSNSSSCCSGQPGLSPECLPVIDVMTQLVGKNAVLETIFSQSGGEPKNCESIR
jgi:hypothetical protein